MPDAEGKNAVKRAQGLVPREPVPGMPDDLADAIHELYPQETVEEVIANWHAIGEDGRDAYRSYLGKALTRRGRRERCGFAAEQLLHPDEPIPAPLGSDGGGG
jgi:hypothetical protein